MRYSTAIALLIIALAGCDRPQSASAPAGQQQATGKPVDEAQLFRTADFEFLMPEGWKFLESESQPDRVVFESADGLSRVTLSVMYLHRDLAREEARSTLARIVEHRRIAEAEPPHRVRLTAHKITDGTDFWYSKWGGRDEAADRRTGTLVTLENKKLFTVYVESTGSSDQALDALANEVFGSFKTK